MSAAPRVAVVVPVFNKLPLTLRFLKSFRVVAYSNYQIIIVDDGSSDGTSAVLAEQHPEVVLPGCPNPLPVDVLTGCGTLVPADCYRKVGLYDTRWCPQYHGDSEFVLRAGKGGYRALVDIRAVIWNDVQNTGKNTNIFFR